MMRHVDRLETYQGAARDERPYGDRSESGWRVNDMKGETDHRCHKLSPRKRTGGTPVGSSGRIALRREHCGVQKQ
jgi:hypothetical protein